MWNHILDKQPDHLEEIIQLNNPYQGHCGIGMRIYDQNCSFQEILQFNKENDLLPPDFWWVSCKDFPFPQDERFKDTCKE